MISTTTVPTVAIVNILLGGDDEGTGLVVDLSAWLLYLLPLDVCLRDLNFRSRRRESVEY